MAFPLSPFVRQVPTCSFTAPLSKAVDVCIAFESHQLIVLDSTGNPQGLVQLPKLLKRSRLVSPGDPPVSSCADLFEDIVVRSLEAPIKTIWVDLATQPQSVWVLMEANGRLAGVLDSQQLLLQGDMQSGGALSLQQLATTLGVPARIQAPEGLQVCNEAWSQKDPEGRLHQDFQIHRLPLRSSEHDDIWLEIALPPDVDPALLNSWITGVSHELKSPLTSLLGLSTLLADTRLGALNPKQTHYANLIQRTVRQLAATVNHLLDWVRLDSGQLAIHLTQLDLLELRDQIWQQLQAEGFNPDRLEQLKQGFYWQVPEHLRSVMADPLRLRQIMIYLIRQSLTDTQGIGSLTAEAWGRWIALTLEGGIPIPAERQPYWFRPQGVGGGPSGLELGPVLAWHLSRLHGGDISFRSSPEGNFFTVLLPQRGMVGKSPSEQATQLLLLLASEPTVIDQVVMTLHPGSLRVAIARSFPEAVDKALRLRPKLLFVAMEDRPDCQDIPRLRQRLSPNLPIVPLHLEPNPPPGTIAIADVGYPLPPLLQDLLQISPPPLTVLYLRREMPSDLGGPAEDRLSHLLHQYHCRVLEVDDPSQADLLTRVWQPQVMLLDAALTEPSEYLQAIAQAPSLKQCPLVLLDAEAAAAASRFPQLRWYACPGFQLPQSATALMHLLYDVALER